MERHLSAPVGLDRFRGDRRNVVVAVDARGGSAARELAGERVEGRPKH